MQKKVYNNQSDEDSFKEMKHFASYLLRMYTFWKTAVHVIDAINS